MLPGDLIYYDKTGGSTQTTFPFAEDDVRGIGIIVSEVLTYIRHGTSIPWVWIIDENGNKVDFLLDYLEPIIT